MVLSEIFKPFGPFQKFSVLSISFLVGLVLSIGVGFAEPASAKLIRKHDAHINGLAHSHVHLWQDDERPHQAVVIALHGLLMYGGVFDKMASNLANQGYIVVAADMRGYGRWSPSNMESTDLSVRVSTSKFDENDDLSSYVEECHLTGSCRHSEVLESEKFLSEHSKVKYHESYKDLLQLTKAVKANYPDLPLFLVGESMGAGMAIHIAGEAPECVSGMVLSSPAIKKKFNLVPRILLDVARFVRHPKKPVDLKPYILKFASEDPEIAKSCAEDPQVRKALRPGELLQTSKEIARNIKYADLVNPDIPVLIIQGDRDRMVKSNGVVTLLHHLKSKDQTVKWFPGKGHLLLETPYITGETLEVVTQWLNHHSRELKPAQVTALPFRATE